MKFSAYKTDVSLIKELVFFALCLIVVDSEASSYTITNLGTLGSDNEKGSSWAYDINEKGQIVGNSSIGGITYSFLYENGVMTNIAPQEKSYNTANAINNHGEIVGQKNINVTGANYEAYLYKNGQMIGLGTNKLDYSYATDINDNGQIVGVSGTGNGSLTKGFLYQNGVMSDIGSLGGVYTNPESINNSGQVVGYSQNSKRGTEAFLFENGKMTGIGSLVSNANDSRAKSINEDGSIAGSTQEYYYSPRQGFLIQNNQVSDFDSHNYPFSMAYDINNLNEVVGISGNSIPEAFVYKDGKLNFLYSLLIGDVTGWTELRYANAINDKGQIVGMGIFNGLERAFLLTEIPTAPTIWLIGSGLIAFLGIRKLKFLNNM
ncbi:DUF3466 family protein [Methylomonas sp. MS20]|uniref:DUF3466 family protein n=1 Tax=Methylomonas sp. MS20 TaxID=3418769 RepID=UPI003D0528B0